jgi:hypothetical protein
MNPPAVKTRTLNWADLVKQREGEDYAKKEPAYEFSNGRKFEDTGSNGGVYQPS